MFIRCRCSLINVSAAWLTDHLLAYRAWAASEVGASQLARATLVRPARLRSPLTPADEQRVLAELDAGAARDRRLKQERQELAARAEQLRWHGQQLQAQLDASVTREAHLQAEVQDLSARYRRRCEEADEEAAAMLQRVGAAAQEATALRRRLALSESRRRREQRVLCAVTEAAQAAERAAAEKVRRVASRPPPPLPPMLGSHLRQTAEGRGGDSSARRTARRLLGWLSGRLA